MSAKKILIIDDDEDLVMGLAIRLKSWGYIVTVATDALSAISVGRKELPDLVLLDLGLPGGDGFVVMERMRRLMSLLTVPIIVLTARDAAGNAERARKAGAFAFFQKPVENNALLRAITQALGDESITRTV